ncbi:MAG: HD domain-containing protein [Clostridia bacterium]|nr:HD domain-containing protein [Clostridia bacterium]
MGIKEQLILKMTEFERGYPKRIQHFLKVYEFAHIIASDEGLDDRTREILEVTAIVHDIGIKPSKLKYGYCDGKTQEIEGPLHAREMFKDFPELDEAFIERVCYLIAHHHSYDNVDGIDYRILIEADFLVNSFEDKMEKDAIISVREKIFRTPMAIRLLNTMFDL